MSTLGDTAVTFSDGGLGVAARVALPLAVVGCSSSGTAATPYLLNTIEDAIATLGHGPLVEYIAAILRYGAGPVIGCRATTTAAGSESAVGLTGSGTAVLSVTTSGARDAYKVRVLITRPGANLAAATAAMRLSIDGGESYGEEQAVPVGGVFVVGDTGVGVTFADGTFVEGDVYAFDCTAPTANQTNLTAAVNALLESQYDHEGVCVAGPVTGAVYTALASLMADAEADGVYRWILCEPRTQGGDSVSTWSGAIITDFASASSRHGAVCAGEADQASPGIGGTHRRNVARLFAARLASITASGRPTGIAESPMRVRSGPIAGVATGALHHDLRTLATLDTNRFLGLRTFAGLPGYYATVRSTAPNGSDLTDFTLVRVIKAAMRAVQGIIAQQVGDTVTLASNGTLDPSEADALDASITAAFGREMEGLVSSVQVSVNRTDNLASTKRLRASFRAVPLGYTNAISADVGYQLTFVS